jgi:hypothetical protein
MYRVPVSPCPRKSSRSARKDSQEDDEMIKVPKYIPLVDLRNTCSLGNALDDETLKTFLKICKLNSLRILSGPIDSNHCRGCYH